MAEEAAKILAAGGMLTDFVCPNCGVHSQHSRNGVANTFKGEIDVKIPQDGAAKVAFPEHVRCQSEFVHAIWRCLRCGHDTYFLVRTKTTPLDMDSLPTYLPDNRRMAPLSQPMPLVPEAVSKDWVVHQHPILTPTSHSAVQQGVKSAAIEAEKCLAVGAYNACGVMTRRAVHSLCEDKGAEGRDLFAQLNDLKTKQLITPDLYDWADSLRVLGRDGAHPEFPEVTADDAEDGVKLLREIVKYVYILPHERAEKRRGK